MPGHIVNDRVYPNAALRLLQRELIGPAPGAQVNTWLWESRPPCVLPPPQHYDQLNHAIGLLVTVHRNARTKLSASWVRPHWLA
jgi:hypothetical protein